MTLHTPGFTSCFWCCSSSTIVHYYEAWVVFRDIGMYPHFFYLQMTVKVCLPWVFFFSFLLREFLNQASSSSLPSCSVVPGACLCWSCHFQLAVLWMYISWTTSIIPLFIWMRQLQLEDIVLTLISISSHTCLSAETQSFRHVLQTNKWLTCNEGISNLAFMLSEKSHMFVSSLYYS